jgi:hypothetical protein
LGEGAAEEDVASRFRRGGADGAAAVGESNDPFPQEVCPALDAVFDQQPPEEFDFGGSTAEPHEVVVLVQHASVVAQAVERGSLETPASAAAQGELAHVHALGQVDSGGDAFQLFLLTGGDGTLLTFINFEKVILYSLGNYSANGELYTQLSSENSIFSPLFMNHLENC